MSDTATQAATQKATEYMEYAESVQSGDILIGKNGGETVVLYTDARFEDDGTIYTAATEFGVMDLGWSRKLILIKRPLSN